MFENGLVLSRSKVKLTGNYLTFFDFERSFRVAGYRLAKFFNDGFQTKKEVLTVDEIRVKSMRRAKRTVVDLINCNMLSSYKNSDKFLTLTQGDYEQDIKTSNEHLRRFVRRLNAVVSSRHHSPVRYVSVPQFQKNGTVHYHLMLFGMPFVPVADIEKMWGRGFVKLNRIRQGTDVGAYITRYMVKDVFDKRLMGEKCYMTSQGLEKPFVSTVEEVCDYLKNHIQGLARKIWTSLFPVPFLVSVAVEKYDLSRYPQEVRYLKRYLAENSLIY